MVNIPDHTSLVFLDDVIKVSVTNPDAPKPKPVKASEKEVNWAIMNLQDIPTAELEKK